MLMGVRQKHLPKRPPGTSFSNQIDPQDPDFMYPLHENLPKQPVLAPRGPPPGPRFRHPGPPGTPFQDKNEVKRDTFRHF